jgi:hypothetical protein
MILTKEVLPPCAAPLDVEQHDRALERFELLIKVAILFVGSAYVIWTMLERSWSL